MQSIDWDNVRYFLEVVRSGSVSKAAERLDVNQTTVSRRISALEHQLGKKLFERSVNGWVITPVGEQLISSADHMSEEVHNIERYVMADSQELRGRLRLTVGDVCTQQLAMPTIQSFLEKYPEIELEIIATSEALDLTAFEADIALRQTDNPPLNLVGKRITQFAYAVYGNKTNLEAFNTGATLNEFPCITWLGDGESRPDWIEKSFPKTRRIYRTSNLGVMQQMTRQGIGISQLPCALGDIDSDLHRIPVPYVEPGWGLWVLSHANLRTTARVRIFKDLLVADLEKKKHLIEGSGIKK
jgi:DNA-binding transcriptional LysR family regulator